MREFDSLAFRGEYDRVVADNVTASQRMHCDFTFWSRARVALSAVNSFFFFFKPARFFGEFDEADSRSAWRVFFVMVVHFDDFDIVIFVENSRRVFCQREKQVYAYAEIRRVDYRNNFCRFGDCSETFRINCRCTEDGCDFLFCVNFQPVGYAVCEREIDNRISVLTGGI